MPAPPDLETNRTTTTRRRLTDAAAAELIAAQGGLEMQSVARAAGVVPSVVSHHFGSRAGLVGAVVEAFFDAYHAEVLDLDLRHLGPWAAREHERVRRGVRFHLREPLAPIVYGSLCRDAQIAAIEARRIERVLASSARNLASAQRDGDLLPGVDPILAAAAIFGAARQITVAAFTADPRPSEDAIVDQLWRVTTAAVTPTDKAPRTSPTPQTTKEHP